MSRAPSSLTSQHVRNLSRVVSRWSDACAPGLGASSQLASALLAGDAGGASRARADLSAAFSALLAWLVDFASAARSVQDAFDAAATAALRAGAGAGDARVRAAEAARERLGELEDGFGAEASVRATVVRALTDALEPGDERDRERLGVATCAWAVRAHLPVARGDALVDALEML